MSKLTQWKKVNRYRAFTLALNTIFLRGKKKIKINQSSKISCFASPGFFIQSLNRRSDSFVLDVFEEMSNGSITWEMLLVTYRKKDKTLAVRAYLKMDYPGVRTGMFPQLRCCDSSCLCKYALLRGLTPMHNSVPLLYREDTLTQRKKASKRNVYFSDIPILERSFRFRFCPMTLRKLWRSKSVLGDDLLFPSIWNNLRSILRKIHPETSTHWGQFFPIYPF